jgi:hypothetical protein
MRNEKDYRGTLKAALWFAAALVIVWAAYAAFLQWG